MGWMCSLVGSRGCPRIGAIVEMGSLVVWEVGATVAEMLEYLPLMVTAEVE